MGEQILNGDATVGRDAKKGPNRGSREIQEIDWRGCWAESW